MGITPNLLKKLRSHVQGLHGKYWKNIKNIEILSTTTYDSL